MIWAIKKDYKVATVFFIAIIIFLYGAVFSQFYFTHSYLPTHDYNVAFVSSHIVTNYFINGHIPLWAPEQNSGSPVWPDAETLPGYDPVALAVNFIYAFFNSNSVYAHLVTIFIWHVIFALGGFLIFRRLGLSRTASIFGFTILLFSTLTALNFRQADDYVTVYRYSTLLFYALLRFFKGPSFKNSIFTGLIFGVAISGYQTPNIMMLLFFVFLASIPFIKELKKDVLLKLIPALIVSVLIWLPFMVSALFWVTNKAVARELFKFGYRGDLADIVGPVSRVYADETLIYIGLIPIVFAFLGALSALKKYFLDKPDKYWPSLFMLTAGIFIWIMYIGFPENFTGVDKPFFNVRSFNNMLPYVLFIIVYFSSEYVDKLKHSFKEMKLKEPVFKSFYKKGLLALLILGGIMVTIFVEISRPGLLTVGFNRYSPLFRPDGGMFIENFIPHFSITHFQVFAGLSVIITAIFAGVIKKRKNVIFGCILMLTLIDLALVNTMLLKTYYARPNPESIQASELKPLLKAPFALVPPMTRIREFNYGTTPWYKQGSVLYHQFSAFSPIQVTWFETNLFYSFVNNIREERFDYLTGVTRPIIYFAKRVILKDKGDVLPALNLVTEDELHSSIVVARNEFPALNPTELPSGKADFKILGYGPNNIRIKVTSDSSAYLVYLDSYSKDWVSYVDNKKSPLIRANYLFKSVFVPEGEHIIDFKYRPYPYIFAFYGRIIGFFVAIALLLI